MDDQFMTAADIAYNIIMKKITDGEYAPGMRLSRRKMAEVTGVSVIPVIEALKRLEEDHLVESKPKWGSFVAVPTSENVRQMYEYREALECQIARILSINMTMAQEGEIFAVATDLDVVSYEDKEVKRKLHLDFHHKLAVYTGNPMLITALGRINYFWILCKALDGIKSVRGDSVRYWHRYLIDEIRSGDPDRAEKAMREHILDSLDPVLKLIPPEWDKTV
ncbi:MAG: GntR family transcriptional regulator [Candidatus Heteroscillospira sp.]|jgi:DNA-binding GntR family transcriptional regulator